MIGNYHARCGVGEKPEVVIPEAYLSLFALPNDYQKILSTARSRNMSFAIVLQDKQQIEAIFEKYYR